MSPAVITSSGVEFIGDTKYYKTGSSNIAHADKNCPHLQDKVAVKMYEEHQLNGSTNKCSDCTYSSEMTDENGVDWSEVFDN